MLDAIEDVEKIRQRFLELLELAKLSPFNREPTLLDVPHLVRDDMPMRFPPNGTVVLRIQVSWIDAAGCRPMLNVSVANHQGANMAGPTATVPDFIVGVVLGVFEKAGYRLLEMPSILHPGKAKQFFWIDGMGGSR